MTNYQVGLTHTDIQHVLDSYHGVLEAARLPDAEALWRVVYQLDDLDPVELLVDNGINRIYIQVLVQIPSDLAMEAVEAVGPYATIGVTNLAGSHYLRGTVFTDFSTVLALTNTLRAIALAFDALCTAVLVPEGKGDATPVPSAPPTQSQSRASSVPMTATRSLPKISPTSVILSKGQNVPLANSGVEPVLTIRAQWTATSTAGGEPELDASAIVVGAYDRVLSDAYFIFFNNTSSPEGAVRLSDGLEESGTGDYAATFVVDTTRLPAEATKVVIALAIYSAAERGHSFHQVPRAAIEVLDKEAETGLVAFEIVDGETETAMILGEMYRHRDTWKFRAIGQGYSSGLAGIATDYGVDVG